MVFSKDVDYIVKDGQVVIVMNLPDVPWKEGDTVMVFIKRLKLRKK